MTDLYDIDTVTWAEQQAALLRRVASGERPNAVPDWSNIAEELDSMGKSQARELASRMSVVLVHLMRLEASPASELRAGWRATVRRERNEIALLLADAPSLRARIGAIIEANIGRARAEAAATLADAGEAPQRECEAIAYSEAQVLGDWLP